MNTENVIAHYVALRDRVKEIEARHKEELEPIKQDMALIEAGLLKYLQEQKAKNLKTAAGTAYISETVSAKVEDWDEQVLPYIIENEAWHLLVRQVNKTNLQEAGDTVPGVSLSTTLKLNVRRA